MAKHTIVLVRKPVGFIATALSEAGTPVVAALGLSADEATRRLDGMLANCLKAPTPPVQKAQAKAPRVVRIKKRRSRKMHSPSSVIFGALRNIEFYKGRIAGRKKKR